MSNHAMDYLLERKNADKMKCIGITALITAFVCYFHYLANGYVCADGIQEGYYYYIGGGWALSLGRWLLMYLGKATLNIVIPPLAVLLNLLCNAVAVFLIADLWKIENKLFLSLATVAMIASPTVVCQFLYIYTAIGYGMAALFAGMAAYLVLRFENKLAVVTAAACLAISLGCYQAYIGFTVAMILITLMIGLYDGNTAAQTLRKAGRAFAMGVLGGILYFVILKINLRLFNHTMASYSGADEIGLVNSIKNLIPAMKGAYSDYFAYYFDKIAFRGIFFAILLFTILGILFVKIGGLIQRKKWPELALLVGCVLILPLGSNIIRLIATERSIETLMAQQMQLLIPAGFALLSRMLEQRSIARRKNCSWGGDTCVVLGTVAAAGVCWVCILTAYATYQTVELSYRYVDTITTKALSRVMDLDGYSFDTRIMFVGFPDETSLQKNNSVSRWSLFTSSPVFWQDWNGSLYGYPRYLYIYFGLNGIVDGTFTEDEYFEIVNSQQFNEMAVFPDVQSTQMINGIAVVKLTDEPLCMLNEDESNN